MQSRTSAPSDDRSIRDELRKIYGLTYKVDLQPWLSARPERTIWKAAFEGSPFAVVKLFTPHRSRIVDVNRDTAFQKFCGNHGFPAPRVIRTTDAELVGDLRESNGALFKTVASDFVDGTPLDKAHLLRHEALAVVEQVARWPADFHKIWRRVNGPIQTFPQHTQSSWLSLSERLAAADYLHFRALAEQLQSRAPELQELEVRVGVSQYQMMPAELSPKDCVMTATNVVVPVDWEDCGAKQWRYINEHVGSEKVLRDNWALWCERATDRDVSRKEAATVFVDAMTNALHAEGVEYPTEFEGDAFCGLQLMQLRDAIDRATDPASDGATVSRSFKVIQQLLFDSEFGHPPTRPLGS